MRVAGECGAAHREREVIPRVIVTFLCHVLVELAFLFLRPRIKTSRVDGWKVDVRDLRGLAGGFDVAVGSFGGGVPGVAIVGVSENLN